MLILRIHIMDDKLYIKCDVLNFSQSRVYVLKIHPKY